MTQSLCILGRQPALGLAELESLYGADKLRPVGTQAALLDVDPPLVDFSRLGGTVKFCKVLTILDTTDWLEIEKFFKTSVPEHIGYLPEGKMRLGLSAYGLKVTPKQMQITGLSLKKVIRSSGRSVRYVPNNEVYLNSAQVLHNQLTSALGWELIFVSDGDKTIVAQNIAEQDIEAYGGRDQARPKRDSYIGMLPPKLAQLIINLAAGQINKGEALSVEGQDCSTKSPIDKTILDPFCGTGVILQEALLMGYKAYGTDLKPRMIDYTKTNLEWLQQNFTLYPQPFTLAAGDATNYDWQDFDLVATETYLGRPFSALPPPQVLEEVMQDVDTIHRKFLKNLASQTKPGFRACLALPAWKTPNGFKHLPTLDKLGELGYTRLSFVHANKSDLIYHRSDQIVGRELVIIVRN